jgi:hypothetical protein
LKIDNKFLHASCLGSLEEILHELLEADSKGSVHIEGRKTKDGDGRLVQEVSRSITTVSETLLYQYWSRIRSRESGQCWEGSWYA